MKRKIRKTGEIVDVISWTAPFGTSRDDTRDFVNYIDSKGRERVNVPMNIYWDFEDVEEVLSADIDWEQRRYEIAKDCINGILGNDEMVDLANDAGLKRDCRDIPTNVSKMSIAFADALIVELKKGVNDIESRSMSNSM